MVGAVQVGHRDRVGVAVHVAAGDVFGHLVECARGEQAAGPQRPDELRRIEAAGHRVHIGVAEHHTDRRPAVRAGDPAGAPAGAVGDRRERLVPARFDQLSPAPDQWPAQSVRVRVERPEGGALRADEAGAEHIVPVAAGMGDPAAVNGQREAARGLTERADPQSGGGHR